MPASPPSGGAAGAVGALDSRKVTGWQERLASALEAASGLDDGQRIDTIRALEKLACVVTAAQAQLSAELDASQRDVQAAAHVPAARQGRGVASQVAWARRESPHRGQRHLGLAKVTTSELPATWHAWRTGRITEWRATLIARETACLSLEDRFAVDTLVAGDAVKLEAMGERELVAAVQSSAYLLDPESFVARRRKAEADRHVTLRPAPDTMTWLSALLPVKDGVAAYAALTTAAGSARASGDPRSKGQVMADALVGRVIQGDATTRSEDPRISLHLTMTDVDLFGTGDDPGYLDGFGSIPAELARELVVGACSRDERLWLQRLYCRPDTGELVAADARSRRFKRSLARFIRLRDQTCRTPWCDAPIRHSDHARPHAEDGRTDADNGQGLCEACNYAKQAPRWSVRPSPDSGGHEVETTLPSGHRYRSRPPPVLASVRTVPIRLDYVLTG